MTAQRLRLSEARWHFQHGPIDLVVEAHGDAGAVTEAQASAWSRFGTVLDELVGELTLLKQPVDGACRLRGTIARRMWRACAVHRPRFITPMAAVAGAVADELIGSYRRDGIHRAWVNNGGDIAVHLAPGASVRVGLLADLATFDPRRSIAIDGRFDVTHAMPVRGIATSGWRGRSFSLGIADSVTVLAGSSAEADAAATIIANAVDADDVRIVRRPAASLKDDSDLGEQLVTVDVPSLGVDVVRRALQSGLRRAVELRDAGHIVAAVLVCQGVAASTDGVGFGSLRDVDGAGWHASRFNEAALESA